MLASALLPSSKGMSQTARPLPKPGVRQSLPLLQRIQPKGKVINKKQPKGPQPVDASTTLWVNAKGGGETGYSLFTPQAHCPLPSSQTPTAILPVMAYRLPMVICTEFISNAMALATVS